MFVYDLVWWSLYNTVEGLVSATDINTGYDGGYIGITEYDG